jgi:hypothetical protein
LHIEEASRHESAVPTISNSSLLANKACNPLASIPCGTANRILTLSADEKMPS